MKFVHINKAKLRCPTCGSQMMPAISILGNESPDWVRCEVFPCKTFIDTSVPLDHQAMIMKDASRRLGVFGAFGSGKTFANYKVDEKHILTTPMGETLVGADTLVQLENTVRKDFERDFPGEFVRSYNRQKNMITFVNGHVLYYRPLSEIGDVRSYNLTRAHLLEASGIKHEAYVELQSRMRNEAAIIYEEDEHGDPIVTFDEKTGAFRKEEKLNWIQMVLESNPDSGWIKYDILLKSANIHVHHETNQKYFVDPNKVLSFLNTHIIPTRANPYLPADFIDNMASGKPGWWVKRYLLGSFDYAEGLVYPEWASRIIEDFEIPSHWPRLIGYDYGLSDKSHFVYGAVDEHGEHFGKPAVFFYASAVTSDRSISQLAQVHKKELRDHVPMNNLWTMPRMDGRSYHTRTRTNDKKTIGTLFQEEGCFFRPAQMDLDARIMHVNDLIERGVVWFFKKGMAPANEEGMAYKFPEKKLEKSTKADDKPIDARNHGVNAIEFILMQVPRIIKPKGNNVHTISSEPSRRRKLKAQWDPLREEPTEEVSETEGFASAFDF